MKKVFIEPTGNNDTARIQDALSAGSVVMLFGSFTLTAPLFIKAPAWLIGDPCATVSYWGAPVDFAVEVSGFGSRIANVQVRCNGIVGGVRFSGCTYRDIAEHVGVYDYRGVGAEFANSWNGNVRDLRVFKGAGVAVRCSKSNSVHLDGLQVDSCDCSGDGLSGLVQVLDSNLFRLTSACLETNVCGLNPAIYARGNTTAVNGLRLEANQFSGPQVVVEGDGYWSGTNTSFDQVLNMQSEAHVFAELRGATRDTTVRHLMAAKFLRKAIVRTVGTKHTGISVSHCFAAGVPDIVEARL